MRTAVLFLAVTLLASCGAGLLPDGVDCDPMVYQSGNPGEESIWLLADSDHVRLTGPGTRDFNPEWSPDGDRIAYVSGVGPDFDLVVMAADGSDRRVVWDGGEQFWANAVDWSPDASQLVFDAWGPDIDLQVFVISVDGGEAKALTSSGINGKPAWSNDGQRIFYLSLASEDAQQDVFSMASDGSDVIDLTENPGHLDALAEPSPNGSTLVFRSDRSGSAEIWLMGIDGENPRQLTDLAGVDSNPSWSSDGDHVLFTHEIEDRPPEVWVVGADGSDPRRIFSDGFVPDCP